MRYLILVTLILLVMGCAYQPYPTGYNSPGFFSGIFHGLLIVFSFIGSIFSDVRIYAFPNTGFGYDFGFVIGIFIFLGFFNAK